MKSEYLRSVAILLAASITASVNAQDDTRFAGEGADERIFVEKTTQTVGPAPGTIFTVNDPGDVNDANAGDGICETSAGNNICTLRAAVSEANALTGDDVIVFDEAVTLVQTGGEIPIASNLSILGNGPDATTLQNVVGPNLTARIFAIQNFVVTLGGLTITGGNATENGGGILNAGTLTIINCVITGNTTTDIGGGIRSTNTLHLLNSVVSNNSTTNVTSGGISFSGVTLVIRNSTIHGNTAVENGGGANISASSSVTISDSTISNNITGAASGGFFLNRGTVTNTTITGNQANGALAFHGGGGVRIQSGSNTVEFISCTITNNTAPNTAGGTRNGVWHETGSVVLRNTVVAENGTQDIVSTGGTLASNGFNLIGVNTGVETQFPAGLPSGTDYVGTSASPLSPMLAPLADNGGTMATQMPIAGSPVIDKGHSSGSLFDQRGFLRTIDQPTIPNTPNGDGTDIGSVEMLSTPNSDGITVSGTVTDSSGRLVSNAIVVLNGDVTRTTRSSSFGHFRFENVHGGEAYLVTVRSRSLQFAPTVITAVDTITDLDISALP